MLSKKNANYIYRLNQLVFLISLIITIDGLIPRKQIHTNIESLHRPLEYNKHRGYEPSTTKVLIVMENNEMLAGIRELRGVEVGKKVLLYKTRILGVSRRIWAKDDSFIVDNIRVIHRYFFFLPWLIMILALYTIKHNSVDVLINFGITNIILLLFHFYLLYH